MKTNVICPVCGKHFYRNPAGIKENTTCSRECRSALCEQKMKKGNTKCVICGKSIYRKPALICDHNACSISCRNKYFSKERSSTWKGGIKNKEQIRKKDKERRLRNKLRSIEYLGGECKRCGYKKCYAAMDFHHINPLEKDSNIKGLINGSWEKLAKELDKCILLCCRCHRELHWEERNGSST